MTKGSHRRTLALAGKRPGVGERRRSVCLSAGVPLRCAELSGDRRRCCLCWRALGGDSAVLARCLDQSLNRSLKPSRLERTGCPGERNCAAFSLGSRTAGDIYAIWNGVWGSSTIGSVPRTGISSFVSAWWTTTVMVRTPSEQRTYSSQPFLWATSRCPLLPQLVCEQ